MERLQPLLDRAVTFWGEALEIWRSGGWAMVPIAITALVLFGLGVHIRLRFARTGFLAVPEATWRRWIDRPVERTGRLGELLDLATHATTIPEMAAVFRRLAVTETAPFERDLRVMKICVGAAPLLGLLGTVTGMLATFGALASGSGGDQTMAMVAKGISEALITTETGLVVALPGLFFQYELTRTFERYRSFLAHLETVCTQALFRRQRAGEHARAEAEARRLIAERLAQGLRARRPSAHRFPERSSAPIDQELEHARASRA